jgi:hypothetical protein
VPPYVVRCRPRLPYYYLYYRLYGGESQGENPEF